MEQLYFSVGHIDSSWWIACISNLHKVFLIKKNFFMTSITFSLLFK